MGIKTAGRGNKNLDLPGPGEYDPYTFVPSNYPPSIAHVMGTGQRSDLGVGKSHMFPGPGQYETDGSRIYGPGYQYGFGTEFKSTEIKKTFEPGPGSYDLPTTVGHIPKYLLLGNTVNAQRSLRSNSPPRNE